MLFTFPPAETMQAKSATRAKKTVMDLMLCVWFWVLVLAFDSKNDFGTFSRVE